MATAATSTSPFLIFRSWPKTTTMRKRSARAQRTAYPLSRPRSEIVRRRRAPTCCFSEGPSKKWKDVGGRSGRRTAADGAADGASHEWERPSGRQGSSLARSIAPATFERAIFDAGMHSVRRHRITLIIAVKQRRFREGPTKFYSGNWIVF